MKIKNIIYEAKNRLKKNYIIAVSLTFTSIIGYFCFVLFSQLVSILSREYIIDFELKPFIISFFLLLFYLLLLSPLILGTKGWYFELENTPKPIHEAFSFYSKAKSFFNSFFFFLITKISAIFIAIIIYFPTIILAAFIKIGYYSNNVLSLDYGGLIVLFLVFLITETLIYIYVSMGFFFTDYIFIRRETLNPFKAIKKSFRLTRGYRNVIIKMFLSYTPYFLMFILIIPIPFIIPRIKSGMAQIAKERFKNVAYI